MVTLDNPNDPPQPNEGVYMWYAKKNKKVINVYIGESGYKKSKYSVNGTLKRGITELNRDNFTTNSPHYNSIDTDFIIGTALKYLEEKGWECHWKHISNNPKEEAKFCAEYKPWLQESTKIKKEFRLIKPEGRWVKKKDWEIAEKKLMDIFEKNLKEKGIVV